MYPVNNSNNGIAQSGGVMLFNTVQNGTIKIIDSIFINNGAYQSGGVISITSGGSELEVMIMNNHFDSNSAYTGGVFNFNLMNGSITTLQNNTYRNNSAFGKRRVDIIMLSL